MVAFTKSDEDVLISASYSKVLGMLITEND